MGGGGDLTPSYIRKSYVLYCVHQSTNSTIKCVSQDWGFVIEMRSRLLLVVERPGDLVVVARAQVDHDVLVAEEEHHRAGVVQLVHVVEVRHLRGRWGKGGGARGRIVTKHGRACVYVCVGNRLFATPIPHAGAQRAKGSRSAQYIPRALMDGHSAKRRRAMHLFFSPRAVFVFV